MSYHWIHRTKPTFRGVNIPGEGSVSSRISTRFHFEFLTSEFDFDKPNYTFSEQSNGTVIADIFEFNNSDNNLRITISNAYHPVDYGFEINLTDLNTGAEEMIHHVLKENQDIEQSYL